MIDHLPYLVLAVMSKYAVETSFLGHRVPKEVKLLLKNVKNVKKDVYSASIGKSKTKAKPFQLIRLIVIILNYEPRIANT